MSDDAELSISELRRKRAQSNVNSPSAAPRPGARPLESTIIEAVPSSPMGRAQPPSGPPPDYEEKIDLPFDPWRLPEALRLRWHWLVLAAFALGLLGGAAGYWRGKYSIHVTLTLRDLSARFIASQEGESYKPPQLSSQTLVNFLTSPDLIGYVSANANPPVSEKRLLSDLTVKQDRDSETINIMLLSKNPTNLVDLANLYTRAAVEVSKEAQMENPSLMYTNFTKKLEEIKTNEDELEAKLTSLRTNAGVIDPELENPAFEKERVDLLVKIDMTRSELDMLDAKNLSAQNSPVQKRLQDAEDRLKALQEKGLLDAHPDVIRVRAEIDRLTRQLTSASGVENPDPLEDARKKDLTVEVDELQKQSDVLKMKVDKLYEHAGEYNQVMAELNFLQKVQKTLEDRLFEAQQYRDNAEGYYKLSPEAELKDVDMRGRIHKAVVYGVAGGFAGFMAAMLVILFTEIIDPRMKTAADVRRVTQLPVLATLGNLKKMNDEARKAWAFRTWTILSGTLSPSANYGTVCGIISCAHGEGRSTWVELLVGAARERGFEVTKLDFGRTPKNPSAGAGNPSAASPIITPPPENPGETAAPATEPAQAGKPATLTVRETHSALSQANYASVIHIQLPGLVWNLERRIQFQEELDKWREMSRAVILIDLPPASVPEAILLAENLPQVLWLVDSGKSHARETRLHLETLRHARCKLVGAVLNHEPEPLIKL